MSDTSDENILKSIKIIETECGTCGEIGTLKHVSISDVKPQITFVIFECKSCNTKETSMFNTETSNKKIIIECNFDNENDLRRELNLNMHAKVIIKTNDINYEYSSMQPLVTPVEGIIIQAHDEISNTENMVLGDRNKMLEVLEHLKDTPVFYMRIEDDSGYSRVGQIGRGVYEMQDLGIEEFNDEKVKHVYVDK